MNKEYLRELPLFSELQDSDLDRLFKMTRPLDVKAGEILIREGDPGDALYVVVDGEFEVTRLSGDKDVVLSRRKAGEHIGEMSLLDQAPRLATVRALRDSKVLAISQEAFQQVLSCSPSAVTAVLRTVTTRLRSSERLVVQNEKMAALGTLSAGLAHELNNPAAAVQRTTDQLRETFAEWQRLSLELDALGLTPEQTTRLNALREEMGDCEATPTVLDPLARSDREGELQDWLDDHGVDQAWEHVPRLVSYGWDVGLLEDLSEVFSAAQLGVVVPWLAVGCSANALLDEVSKSAERISEIVKAVKSYSYLDQAPIQQVDVRDGLENTLVILRHKLKSGVTVERDYAPDLPRIEAYASELNQVWTNIIDNATDAMKGQGVIKLRTYKDADYVVVEITDNGPGIPPEVRPRIFEAFYTTKELGVGTGLGLHIAYNIVVDKHHGRISVESKPGETRFRVSIPIKLVRE
jgi:signal transduction histidine kinase